MADTRAGSAMAHNPAGYFAHHLAEGSGISSCALRALPRNRIQSWYQGQCPLQPDPQQGRRTDPDPVRRRQLRVRGHGNGVPRCAAHPGFKTYDKAKLNGQLHSQVRPGADLLLADLGSKALRKLGVERKRLIDTEKDQYPITRLWAEAIHGECPDVQGMCWTSRQDDSARAMVSFGDRVDPGLLRQAGGLAQPGAGRGVLRRAAGPGGAHRRRRRAGPALSAWQSPHGGVAPSRRTGVLSSPVRLALRILLGT